MMTDVCCPCACRDCMEITYGGPGSFCNDCRDAGCELHSECLVEPDPDSLPELEPLPSAQQIVDAGTAIRAKLEHDGVYMVTEGTLDPRLVIPRLVAALNSLDPSAAAELTAPGSSFSTLPTLALDHEHHPYWASDAAERLVMDLMMALNRAAPAGFIFSAEGEWHNLGFFRK